MKKTRNKKRISQMIVSLSAVILLSPLAANSAVQVLNGIVQSQIKADKRKPEDPKKGVTKALTPERKINQAITTNVKYSQGVPVLNVSISPSKLNYFDKGEKIHFQFDTKNVDLSNIKASKQKSLPFKYSKNSNGELTLTFTKSVKSGNYGQAFAIPTKNVDMTTKVTGEFNGQALTIGNNEIKSQLTSKQQSNNQATPSSKSNASDSAGAATQPTTGSNQTSQPTENATARSAAPKSAVTQPTTAPATQEQSVQQQVQPTMATTTAGQTQTATTGTDQSQQASTATTTESEQTQQSQSVSAQDAFNTVLNKTTIEPSSNTSSGQDPGTSEAITAPAPTASDPSETLKQYQQTSTNSTTTSEATGTSANDTTAASTASASRSSATTTPSSQVSQSPEEAATPASVATKPTDVTDSTESAVAETSSTPQSQKSGDDDDGEALFRSVSSQIKDKTPSFNETEQGEIIKTFPWVLNDIASNLPEEPSATDGQIFKYSVPLTTGRNALITIDGRADTSKGLDTLEANMPGLLKSLGSSVQPGLFDQAVDVDTLQNSDLYDAYQQIQSILTKNGDKDSVISASISEIMSSVDPTLAEQIIPGITDAAKSSSSNSTSGLTSFLPLLLGIVPLVLGAPVLLLGAPLLLAAPLAIVGIPALVGGIGLVSLGVLPATILAPLALATLAPIALALVLPHPVLWAIGAALVPGALATIAGVTLLNGIGKALFRTALLTVGLVGLAGIAALPVIGVLAAIASLPIVLPLIGTGLVIGAAVLPIIGIALAVPLFAILGILTLPLILPLIIPLVIVGLPILLGLAALPLVSIGGFLVSLPVLALILTFFGLLLSLLTNNVFTHFIETLLIITSALAVAALLPLQLLLPTPLKFALLLFALLTLAGLVFKRLLDALLAILLDAGRIVINLMIALPVATLVAGGVGAAVSAVRATGSLLSIAVGPLAVHLMIGTLLLATLPLLIVLAGLPFVIINLANKLLRFIVAGTIKAFADVATLAIAGLTNLAALIHTGIAATLSVVAPAGNILSALLFLIPALTGLMLLSLPLLTLLSLPLVLGLNVLIPVIVDLITRLALPIINAIFGFLPLLGVNLVLNTLLFGLGGPLFALLNALPILLLSLLTTSGLFFVLNRVVPLALAGLVGGILTLGTLANWIGQFLAGLVGLPLLALTAPLWVGLPLLNLLRQLLNFIGIPLLFLVNNLVILPLTLLANALIAPLLAYLLTFLPHLLGLLGAGVLALLGETFIGLPLILASLIIPRLFVWGTVLALAANNSLLTAILMFVVNTAIVIGAVVINGLVHAVLAALNGFNLLKGLLDLANGLLFGIPVLLALASGLALLAFPIRLIGRVIFNNLIPLLLVLATPFKLINPLFIPTVLFAILLRLVLPLLDILPLLLGFLVNLAILGLTGLTNPIWIGLPLLNGLINLFGSLLLPILQFINDWIALPLAIIGGFLATSLLPSLLTLPIRLIGVGLSLLPLLFGFFLPALLFNVILPMLLTIPLLLGLAALPILLGLAGLALGAELLNLLGLLFANIFTLPLLLFNIVKNALIFSSLVSLILPLIAALLLGAGLWAISIFNSLISLGLIGGILLLSLLTAPLWLGLPLLNLLRQLAALATAFVSLPLALLGGLLGLLGSLAGLAFAGLFALPLGLLVAGLSFIANSILNLLNGLIIGLVTFGIGLAIVLGLKLLWDILKGLFRVALFFLLTPLVLLATLLSMLVLGFINALAGLVLTLLNNLVLDAFLLATFATLVALPLVGLHVLANAARVFSLAAVLVLNLFLGLFRIGSRLVMSFILGFLNLITRIGRDIAGLVAGLSAVGALISAFVPVPGHLLVSLLLLGLSLLSGLAFLVLAPLSLVTGLLNLVAKLSVINYLLTLPLRLLADVLGAVAVSLIAGLAVDLLALPLVLLAIGAGLLLIGLPILVLATLAKLAVPLILGLIGLTLAIGLPLAALAALTLGLLAVRFPLLALILLGLPSLIPFFNLALTLGGLLALGGLLLSGLKLILLPFKLLLNLVGLGLLGLLVFGVLSTFNNLVVLPLLSGLTTLLILGGLGLLLLPLLGLGSLLLNLIPALLLGELARFLRLFLGGIPFFLGALALIVLPIIIGLLTALLPGINLITIPLALLALLAGLVVAPLALLGLLGNLLGSLAVGLITSLVTDFILNLLTGAFTFIGLPLLLGLAVAGVALAAFALGLLGLLLPVIALAMIVLPLLILAALALPFILFAALALLPFLLPIILLVLPLVLLFGPFLSVVGFFTTQVLIWLLASIPLQLLVNPIRDFEALVISIYTMLQFPVFYWAFGIFFIPLTIGSFIGMFVNWLNPLNYLFYAISGFALVGLPAIVFLTLRAVVHLAIGSLLTLNPLAGIPAFLLFGAATLLMVGLIGLFVLNTFLVTVPLIATVVIELVIAFVVVFANALLTLGINVPNVLTLWVLVPLMTTVPVVLTLLLLPWMLAFDVLDIVLVAPLIVITLGLGLLVGVFANPLTVLIGIVRLATLGLAAIPVIIAGFFMQLHLWLPLTFSVVAFLWYLVFANPVFMVAQWTGLIPIIGWAVQLVTDWIYMPIAFWGTGIITALSFALYLHTLVPLLLAAFIAVFGLIAVLPVLLLVLPIALIGSIAMLALIALPVIAIGLLLAVPLLVHGLASLAVIVWFLAPIVLQLLVNPIADFVAVIISLYTMFLNPVFFWAFSFIFIPLMIGSFIGMFVNWLNPLNILFNAISAFAILGLPIIAVLGLLTIGFVALSALISLNPLAGIPAALALGFAAAVLVGLVGVFFLNTFLVTAPLILVVGIVMLVVDIIIVFANALLNLGINIPNVFTVWVLQILDTAIAVVATMIALPLMLDLDILAVLIALPIAVTALQIGLVLALFAAPLRTLLGALGFAVLGLATIPVFLAGIFMLAQAWLPLTFSLPAFLAYLVFGNPVWMLAQWTGLIPIIGWIVQLVTDWAYMLLGLWLPGILSAVSFALFLHTMLPLVFSAVIGFALLLAILPILLAVLPVAIVGEGILLGAIAFPIIAMIALIALPLIIFGIASLAVIVWFFAPIVLQILVNPIANFVGLVISLYTMLQEPVFFWAFSLFWIPFMIYSFVGCL